MGDKIRQPIRSHRRRAAWIAGLIGLFLGAGPARPQTVPANDPAVVPPKPVYQPMPDFPVFTATSNGFCQVGFEIGTDGTVSDAKIIKSFPYQIFDPNCLVGVQRWKFTPATLDGKPVPFHASFRFTFRPNPDTNPDPQTSYLKPGQWVTLDYTLKPDGSTANVEAIEKADEHTNTIQAVRQVRRMHFAPIIENGVAVEKPHQTVTIGNKLGR